MDVHNMHINGFLWMRSMIKDLVWGLWGRFERGKRKSEGPRTFRIVGRDVSHPYKKRLTAGVAALDKSVAEATQMRKQEHEDYAELTQMNEVDMRFSSSNGVSEPLAQPPLSYPTSEAFLPIQDPMDGPGTRGKTSGTPRAANFINFPSRSELTRASKSQFNDLE